MTKPSGKENSPIDVYVLSIGREDSWVGTPLNGDEEQGKVEEPTTLYADGSTASTCPPVSVKNKDSKSVEEASKVIEIPFHSTNDVKKSRKAPFPRVCPPTQKELEAFRKSPPLPSPQQHPAATAATAAAASASSSEALSPISNTVLNSSPTKEIENYVEREPEVVSTASSPPPPPPPPSQQLSAAPVEEVGNGSGNGARRELEDAIQRIEAHIKTEQAARRAAEGALAQARQQSQDTSPATKLLAVPSTWSCAELQVALEDLANAQLAVQRAHAVVAYILTQQQQPQQQQQTRPSGRTQPAMSITEKKDTVSSSSPGIRHVSAPASPSFTSPLPPLLDGAVVGDMLPSSPTLAKVLTKDRGMSWVAGGPKENPSAKQNWTTPNLKRVKTGAGSDASLLERKNTSSPRSGGTTTPFVRKKESDNPVSAVKRSDSGMMSSSPRSGSGGRGGANSPTAEWNNDRFATGKAEAFMLSQSARWNLNSKGK
jgi:hypothetical protein